MPPRALAYHFYADQFGWTQRQVDEDIGDAMFEWYGKITQARNRAAEMLRKRAEREARRPDHFRG